MMTQSNNSYQDLVINNGVISTVNNLVTSDNTALQGLQMNQFAICANPGSTPMLVPYITPVLLSPQSTKISMDGSSQDNRSQNGNSCHQISNNNQQNLGQIQLANNITIPSNMINSGNLPLGLSYINLSSLTSQAGGTAIPIQLALNTGTNQHFTLPLASITQLTNDLQISNAYTLAPQIKFEPDVSSANNNNNNQISILSSHNFQKTNIKRETDTVVVDVSSNKRCRKKVIVRKSSQITKRTKIQEEDESVAKSNNDNELMHDHKGRPFTYPCNQCPKKFTQNSRLTAHLRCHSGIRPYTCTQCGFSFTQKSYLIRHAAVHKEDRPFTCSVCMKTYKHYGSLANHRKLHCKEQAELECRVTDGLSGSVTDRLDDTIQQTIEAVQMNRQSNYILTYTTSASEMQSTPIVYFNQTSSIDLAGTGPVVFPGRDLPAMSAVSLLPTNRSAINELKAITTRLATDVDEVPLSVATGGHDNKVVLSSSIEHQHHIKQEPSYFNVPIKLSHSDGIEH